MNRNIWLVAPWLFAAVLLDAQEPRGPLTADLAITLPRVGDPQISPDGTTVLYSVGEPSFEANKVTSHIWSVPAAGGAARQITRGSGESSPRWSPDGKTIAYVAKKEGEKDGVPQIHLMYPDGTGTRTLTSLSTGAGGPVWSPDGTMILFTSEVWPDLSGDEAQKSRADEREKSGVKALIFERLLYRHWSSFSEGKRSQLFVATVADGKSRQLTKEDRDVPPFSLGGPPDYCFSANGATVYFTRGADKSVEAWSTNADLCAIPIEGGEVRNLTAANKGWDGSPAVSPDGRFLAYRSQARDGYESDLYRLVVIDLQREGDSDTVSLRDGIEELAWTGPSEIVVGLQENGRHAFWRKTMAKGPPVRVDGAPNMDSVRVGPNGLLVGVTASLLSPREVVSFAAGKTATLTTHATSRLEGRPMPSRESVTWKGALGADVQGWLLKPPGFDATVKYPLIVFIHGGPQGAWLDGWSSRWNPAIFAAAGYVAFLPNPHGSTGFGHAFCEQISGDWGGAVYQDILSGVDFVTSQGFVDVNRMGAAGGSYGGYMVNWILGHDHRFKALVSHAGVYNLESMYGSTEEIWFPEWEFKGPPWENRELYERWSPHRFAKAFKTPTLVIHGELDYRVPVAQGFELFTALQRRGVPSKFLYYPDEGHWVLKPRNSRLWNATVLLWFDRYLK